MENIVALIIAVILIAFASVIIPKMRDLALNATDVSGEGAVNSLNIVRLIGMVISIIVTIGCTIFIIVPFIFDSNLNEAIKWVISASALLVVVLLAFALDLTIKEFGKLWGAMWAKKKFDLIFAVSTATIIVLYILNYNSEVISSSKIASIFAGSKVAKDVKNDSVFNKSITTDLKQKEVYTKRVKSLMTKLDSLDEATYQDSITKVYDRDIKTEDSKIAEAEAKNRISKAKQYKRYKRAGEAKRAKYIASKVRALRAEYKRDIATLQARIDKLDTKALSTQQVLKSNNDSAYNKQVELEEKYNSSIKWGAIVFNFFMFVLDVVTGILGSSITPKQKEVVQEVEEYEEESHSLDINKYPNVPKGGVLNNDDDNINNIQPIRQLLMLKAMIEAVVNDESLSQGNIRTKASNYASVYGFKFAGSGEEISRYIKNIKVLDTVYEVAETRILNEMMLELLEQVPSAKQMFYRENREDEREVA